MTAVARISRAVRRVPWYRRLAPAERCAQVEILRIQRTEGSRWRSPLFTGGINGVAQQLHPDHIEMLRRCVSPSELSHADRARIVRVYAKRFISECKVFTKHLSSPDSTALNACSTLFPRLSPREQSVLEGFNLDSMLFPSKQISSRLRSFCRNPQARYRHAPTFFTVIHRHSDRVPSSTDGSQLITSGRSGGTSKQKAPPLWNEGQFDAMMQLRRECLRQKRAEAARRRRRATMTRADAPPSSSSVDVAPSAKADEQLKGEARSVYLQQLVVHLTLEERVRRKLQRAFWAQSHVRSLFSARQNFRHDFYGGVGLAHDDADLGSNAMHQPSKAAARIWQRDGSVCVLSANGGTVARTPDVDVIISSSGHGGSTANGAATHSAMPSHSFQQRVAHTYSGTPPKALNAIDGVALFRKYLIHHEMKSQHSSNGYNSRHGAGESLTINSGVDGSFVPSCEPEIRSSISVQDAAARFGTLTRMQRLAFTFCFPSSQQRVYDIQAALEAFILFRLIDSDVLSLHDAAGTAYSHFCSGTTTDRRVELLKRKLAVFHALRDWARLSAEVEGQWELIGAMLKELCARGRADLTLPPELEFHDQVLQMRRFVEERPSRVAGWFGMKHLFRTAHSAGSLHRRLPRKTHVVDGDGQRQPHRRADGGKNSRRKGKDSR